MISVRIIPCLDVESGRVVKGIRFQSLQDAGDPVSLAKQYNDGGADELILLDVGASYRSRDIMVEVVEAVSKEVFIPLTVGGGLRSVEDMRRVLHAGADKVALCTAALENPDLIVQGAHTFGSQCIVLSIDAKRYENSWHAYAYGGREDTGLDVIAWAALGESLGSGEILINSIDKDGTRQGYDLQLTRRVAEVTHVPVIASGGAGTLAQITEVVEKGKADAVLIASLLHCGEYRIRDVKQALHEKGVCVRW